MAAVPLEEEGVHVPGGGARDDVITRLIEAVAEGEEQDDVEDVGWYEGALVNTGEANAAVDAATSMSRLEPARCTDLA